MGSEYKFRFFKYRIEYTPNLFIRVTKKVKDDLLLCDVWKLVHEKWWR